MWFILTLTYLYYIYLLYISSFENNKQKLINWINSVGHGDI